MVEYEYKYLSKLEVIFDMNCHYRQRNRLRMVFEGDETMKKNELKNALMHIGVPSMYYNLDGNGRTDERFCLEFVNNGWSVYYSERGVKTTNIRFSSEEDACNGTMKENTNDGLYFHRL